MHSKGFRPYLNQSSRMLEGVSDFLWVLCQSTGLMIELLYTGVSQQHHLKNGRGHIKVIILTILFKSNAMFYTIYGLHSLCIKCSVSNYASSSLLCLTNAFLWKYTSSLGGSYDGSCYYSHSLHCVRGVQGYYKYKHNISYYRGLTVTVKD